MRKIVLHSPAVDRRGGYRDAGETLTVGAIDNDKADVTTAYADELLDSGRAVTITEDRATRDPLDHDGDGRKGGAAPAK